MSAGPDNSADEVLTHAIRDRRPPMSAIARVLGITLALLPGCKPSATPSDAPVAKAPQPVASEEPMPEPRRAELVLPLGEPVEYPGLLRPITLESFVPETVEPDPGDPDDPGGAGINLGLNLGSHTVQTYFNADPQAPAPQVWGSGMRLVVVDYDDSVPSISVTIDGISNEFLADQTRTATVHKGESLVLDDDVSMEFTGHRRNRTLAGHTSPLAVEVRYSPRPNGVHLIGLRPPDHVTWTWRDFEFELLDWDYDTRMELEIRRRRLVPL